jgi:signal transduction histidine kinase
MNTQPRHGFFAWSQPVLLALGFAVLVAVNATSLWLLTRSQSSHEYVVHTLDVENKLANLLLALRRAESAQRGYLLTQNPEYLSSYREAASHIAPSLADIERLTADNQTQRENLSALRAPISARLEELASVVAARDTAGLDAAVALIRDGSGRKHVEEARTIVERMTAEESRLLEQRSRDSAATTFNLFAVNLIGSLLILALGVAALILIRRSVAQRDEANAKLEAANLDLEATIAERTSELEEANQELQRYAYIVSHDLRSPLVNIMGFTAELESLRDDIFTELEARRRPEGDVTSPDNAELKRNYNEALGFIKASIHKMDGLIHAILKLSREGQRQFSPESIDLHELMKMIAVTVAHQIEEAGAEVEIAPLPEIVSDRMALEQVFSNLLDNAVKYLDPLRPGRVEIRGRRVMSHFVVEVADNGRGIPEKDHRRIFDLFRRSGAQDRPGEGIGLAHVRALVRRLGGRISVKSEAGEGSVFSVTLPLRWSPAMERSAA